VLDRFSERTFDDDIGDPIRAWLRGIPTGDKTPPSLGHCANLLDLVRFWYANPQQNHGLVLMADVVPGIDGDQTVRMRNIAGLRLTLRNQ
jgi:hypothetical protein